MPKGNCPLIPGERPIATVTRELIINRMAEVMTLWHSQLPMAWDQIETYCMEMAHAAERTAADMRVKNE